MQSSTARVSLLYSSDDYYDYDYCNYYDYDYYDYYTFY